MGAREMSDTGLRVSQDPGVVGHTLVQSFQDKAFLDLYLLLDLVYLLPLKPRSIILHWLRQVQRELALLLLILLPPNLSLATKTLLKSPPINQSLE